MWKHVKTKTVGIYMRDALMSLLMTGCGNQIGAEWCQPSHPPIPISRYSHINIFTYWDIHNSHIKIFTYQDIHISRCWWQGVEIKLGQSGPAQSSTHSYIKIFTYRDIHNDQDIPTFLLQDIDIHSFVYRSPIYPTSFLKIFPNQDILSYILHPLSRYQNGPVAAQYSTQYSFIDIKISTFSSFLVPNNPPTDFYLCIQPKSLCPRKLWQYIVTLRYKLKNYRNLPPFLMAFKDALTSHSCIVFVLTFACLFVWSRLKGGDRLSLEPDIRRPLKNLSPSFPP